MTTELERGRATDYVVLLPARAPVLSAWAAGPHAARLAGAGEDEIVRTALRCLMKIFANNDRCLAGFQGACSHDWQADPFACGAYSYLVAGGGNAREHLAQPLQRTLYFAGEAADTGGESGTVAGASPDPIGLGSSEGPPPSSEQDARAPASNTAPAVRRARAVRPGARVTRSSTRPSSTPVPTTAGR